MSKAARSAPPAVTNIGAIRWALAILETELQTPTDIWAAHIEQAARCLRVALGE